MKLNPFKKAEDQPDHIHNWELISSTYAPPRGQIPQGNYSEETSNKMLFGVTTLFFNCTDCKGHKKEELLGAEGDTLETLMDKANELGPQMVSRGNETFVLQRYLTNNEVANLPVR